MSNKRKEYYRESLESALEECSVAVTDDQLNYLTDAVVGSIECEDMNFGYTPSARDLYQPEIDRLKRGLEKERGKVNCPKCDGTGTIRCYGPIHYSTSRCWQCDGDGRINIPI